MFQSKRFELCFRSPAFYDKNGRWNGSTDYKQEQLQLQVDRESDMLYPSRRYTDGPVVYTRIRAWDAESYALCLVLVKRRAFGFINQSRFFFLDLHDGDEHALKSKTVQEACQATHEKAGWCLRFRETVRN